MKVGKSREGLDEVELLGGDEGRACSFSGTGVYAGRSAREQAGKVQCQMGEPDRHTRPGGRISRISCLCVCAVCYGRWPAYCLHMANSKVISVASLKSKSSDDAQQAAGHTRERQTPKPLVQ